MSSLVLAMSWLPATTSAGAVCAQSDIGPVLRQSIEAGYAAMDKELILSAYAADARIGTYIRGMLNKSSFGEMVAEDLGRHKNLKAALGVESATLSGEEAVVTIRLTLEGEDGGGAATRREDVLYLKLRCKEKWEIFLQTYRKDYSLPPGGRPDIHRFVK